MPRLALAAAALVLSACQTNFNPAPAQNALAAVCAELIRTAETVEDKINWTALGCVGVLGLIEGFAPAGET